MIHRNAQSLRAIGPRFLGLAFYAAAAVLIANAPFKVNAFSADMVPPDAIKFVQTHCYDCHVGDDAEAGFDVTFLTESAPTPKDATDQSEKRDTVASWVQIYDRVAAGEMPPPDSGEVNEAERKSFLQSTARAIANHQWREAATLGRVRGRRLTNLQLERTLQDLLGIDIPLAKDFSDEPRTGGFTTVADGQPMSHFQLEQHLSAVDLALAEAFRRASSPPDEKIETFGPERIVRTKPKARTREPEMRQGLAVVWSCKMEFYGRIPITTAKKSGWYRFHITASSIKQPKEHGVWCTVRSGPCVSSAPMLTLVGAFEATEQPKQWTFEAWMEEGHMLEIRPRDSALRVAKFAGGQVGAGEGEPQNVPGVAFHEIQVERIHRGADRAQIRKYLFGDHASADAIDLRLVSAKPKADATKLLVSFASRAMRRPVQPTEIQSYIDEVHEELDRGKPMTEALRNGYRSLLFSPRFLYLQETPGRLDHYAVASRLSYLLWQSMPDDELMSLAKAGKLHDPEVLKGQVSRMLAAPRGHDFVKHFADQWLDLRDIDFTEPDPKLFREFDQIVQLAMVDETRLFLHRMLAEDRSVKELIDSDDSFLNSRLARYYRIAGVEGDQMRPVAFTDKDRRGGLLTHGSILKITANGTTTSPILRGVWLAERLLGDHIPPPPQNVPAIEPDIRGAVSIRDMFEKHRSDNACAVCHRKIDPPGFALENFDPAGQWRDQYGKPSKKAPKIDASYELADGRKFKDIDEFRGLVLSRPERIAACVTEKLVTYGTGAPPRFADRPAIKSIVVQSKPSDFGFRTLIDQLVCSDLFLTK